MITLLHFLYTAYNIVQENPLFEEIYLVPMENWLGKSRNVQLTWIILYISYFKLSYCIYHCNNGELAFTKVYQAPCF